MRRLPPPDPSSPPSLAVHAVPPVPAGAALAAALAAGPRAAPAAASPRTAPQSRAVRAARIAGLLGPAPPAVLPLCDGIRSLTRRHFAAHVVPLVRRHWPQILGTPFYEKLEIGACDLYAAAPYTAILCGPGRAAALRQLLGLAAALPLPAPALPAAAGLAVAQLGRLLFPAAQRRIILAAASIVVLDHVFDHCLREPPRARGALLRAVLAGREAPARPELALVRALIFALGEGLAPAERAPYAAALARLEGWIDAEVRGLLGEPDPEGLGHRRAGVEGTIDGLLFPVSRLVDPRARGWMVDVSLFVQILDDYLDLEADLAEGRSTPATQGAWTFADVERAYGATLLGLDELLRAAGTPSPRLRGLLRDLYVRMIGDVIHAMLARPSDGLPGPPGGGS